MAGKKYFRWIRSDCAGSEIIVLSIFLPQVWQLKDLQDKYSSDPINFAHFRQSTNLWQGDCAGSEIILGSIFRPWVAQLKYLQDEYRYDLIIFAHFRPSKNVWQARNISSGCRVTLPRS